MDSSIQSAASYFLVMVVSGFGVYAYQWLRDRSKARKLGYSVRQEDLYNMAAIRETLKDTLKRYADQEKELKEVRDQLDVAQETVRRLSVENAKLQTRLEAALKAMEGK